MNVIEKEMDVYEIAHNLFTNNEETPLHICRVF